MSQSSDFWHWYPSIITRSHLGLELTDHRICSWILTKLFGPLWTNIVSQLAWWGERLVCIKFLAPSQSSFPMALLLAISTGHTLWRSHLSVSLFYYTFKIECIIFWNWIAFIYLPKASIGHKLFDRVDYIPSASFCILSEQEEAWHIGTGQ